MRLCPSHEYMAEENSWTLEKVSEKDCDVCRHYGKVIKK
jgi:hypothetical protein